MTGTEMLHLPPLLSNFTSKLDVDIVDNKIINFTDALSGLIRSTNGLTMHGSFLNFTPQFDAVFYEIYA